MAETVEWRWDHGWVLASVIVAHGSEHPDLAGVISAADYFNRLIVSRAQIETSVNRLRAAALVDPDDPLTPLAPAEALWQKARNSDGFVASIQRLVGLMNSGWVATTEVEPWALSPEDYASALTLYRERMAAVRDRPRGV